MSKTQTNPTSKGAGKLKVSYKVHVVQRNRRARLVEGVQPPSRPQTEPAPQVTVPRISRLLALAHHIQNLLDTGQVRDLAQVARLGHVTRARMTQIMDLLLLAPDIQEEILFLPPTTNGHYPITERNIRHLAAEPSFARQRELWQALPAS